MSSDIRGKPVYGMGYYYKVEFPLVASIGGESAADDILVEFKFKDIPAQSFYVVFGGFYRRVTCGLSLRSLNERRREKACACADIEYRKTVLEPLGCLEEVPELITIFFGALFYYPECFDISSIGYVFHAISLYLSAAV